MTALASSEGQKTIEKTGCQLVTVDAIFTINCEDDPFADISDNIFHSLWPNNDDVENKYVAIRYLGSNVLTNFKIFPLRKVADNFGKNTVQINDPVFKTSFPTISKALVKTVQPCLLEQVFVLVSDKMLYEQWQQSGVQLTKMFAKESMLVHNGDTLSYGQNIVQIVLTEPINQGLWNEKSKVVVVFEGENDLKWLTINKLTKINDVNNNVNNNNLINKPIEINNVNNNNLINKPTKINNVNNNNSVNNQSNTNFSLKPLSFSLDNFSPVPDPNEDPELFAFTSPDNLFSINLFSGDYVEMQIGQSSYKFKLIALVEPNSFDRNTVYISPIQHINLGRPTNVLIKTRTTDKTINAKDPVFPTARQVTLARVASPLTLNRTYQQLFLYSLKDFFEQHLRVVTKDSFIAISIDTLLAKSLFSMHDGNYPPVIPRGSPDAVVWFKVTDIKAETERDESQNRQFLIDPSKTRMTQSGLVQDFAALLAECFTYLGLKPLFSYVAAMERHPNKVFAYARRLRNLISTSLFSDKLPLQTCVLVHSLTRNVGKSLVVKSLAHELGVSYYELDGYDIVSGPGADLKIIGLVRGKLDAIIKNCRAPLVVYFRHIDALVGSNVDGSNGDAGEGGAGGPGGGSAGKNSFNVKFTDMIGQYFKSNQKVVFLASTNSLNKIPNELRNVFNFTVEVTVPNETERQEMFSFLLKARPTVSVAELAALFKANHYNYQLGPDVSLETLTLQSAGLSPLDIVSIVKTACNMAYDRFQAMATAKHTLVVDLVLGNNGYITLNVADFETSINNARNTFSESIGAPKIPNVKWEDVGGLDLVKDEILDTIEMPLKNPYLFNNGLKKRSGILFYGPPGTGKTLLAKAIATNFSLNFFSVKGPELLNMYIGESEANVRKVFQKARDAKPCVVFFDELDSVAPKRGNQGDSGGVMDRIVSQLLSELDGMSDGDDGDGVFVVGATNRPDLLDEALLRPGRFDKMLYLGISDTHEKQLKIMKALTRKFKMDKTVNLDKLVQTFAFNYTGADFYALSSDAMLNAMTRKALETDSKIQEYNAKLPVGSKKINARWWFDNIAAPEDTQVYVREEDFIKARNELVPSVSAEELQHYLRVRNNFEGGKTAAQNQRGLMAGNEGSKDTVSNGVSTNGIAVNEIYTNDMASSTISETDTDLYDDAMGSFATEEETHSSASTISNGKGKERV